MYLKVCSKVRMEDIIMNTKGIPNASDVRLWEFIIRVSLFKWIIVDRFNVIYIIYENRCESNKCIYFFLISQFIIRVCQVNNSWSI